MESATQSYGLLCNDQHKVYKFNNNNNNNKYSNNQGKENNYVHITIYIQSYKVNG
jgi:hypothetical protein